MLINVNFHKTVSGNISRITIIIIYPDSFTMTCIFFSLIFYFLIVYLCCQLLEKPLEGFHVVVDAGNGAGGFFAVSFICRGIALFFSGDHLLFLIQILLVHGVYS